MFFCIVAALASPTNLDVPEEGAFVPAGKEHVVAGPVVVFPEERAKLYIARSRLLDACLDRELAAETSQAEKLQGLESLRQAVEDEARRATTALEAEHKAHQKTLRRAQRMQRISGVALGVVTMAAIILAVR